ncbi:MAG: tRNA (adenosine(37)-N6)-threonylcarbamoyltransferase complex ATPase subunit type 1 TsaE [Candidatus Limnocylindrales bacterium]
MTDPDLRPLSLRVTTTSAEHTRALAAALAPAAQAGDRLALVGPLGAGKTQFAKGFAVGLGIDDVVNSPSFTLMAEYEGRLRLFHQDLYRLEGADEILAGGLLDERQDDGVTLSEWADRLDAQLDPARLTVAIEPTGADARDIEMSGHGDIARRYLEAAAAWRLAAADTGMVQR